MLMWVTMHRTGPRLDVRAVCVTNRGGCSLWEPVGVGRHIELRLCRGARSFIVGYQESTVVSSEEPTVYVVDDDIDIRESLHELLQSVKLHVVSFDSAEEALVGIDWTAPGCLLVDVRMPGMSGLDMQDELRRCGEILPLILLTGHGDVPMAVRAIKNGALEFIEKPFRGQELIDAVCKAIKKNQADREARRQQDEISRRLSLLTQRERQVVDLVIDGMTSKTIAAHFGVSTQAIDAHRGRAMKKLEVDSVATLARLLAPLRAHQPQAQHAT